MAQTNPVRSHYILVDGSSYIHRAYHALPPLITSTGQPTWVVRGVISMLKKLKRTYAHSVLVTVFDAKGKNFRHDLYSDYKIHRAAMPDELSCQIPPLFEIIEAMGIPLISVPGVEADDVIGTLASQLSDLDYEVLISTSDKDLAQLVQKKVTLVDTMKNVTLDEEGVKNKFGVSPDLMIDLLALQGDASDNIPGVPKVGNKTAVSLLNAIGGLDAIYANLDQIKLLSIRGAKSLADKLNTFKDQAYLSYELAKIKKDVLLNKTLESLSPAVEDKVLLKQLFETLEFRAWSDELLPIDAVQTTDTLKSYEIILKEAPFFEWLNAINQAEVVAFDIATTTVDYMDSQLVGLSFSIGLKSVYLPCAHEETGTAKPLPLAWILNQLKTWLESKEQLKISQNLKYIYNVLLRYNIVLKGVIYDVLLESYVLDSTAARHNLFNLAQFYLNRKITQYTEIVGQGVKQIDFDQVPVEMAAGYAAGNAETIYDLHPVLFDKIQEFKKLWCVYEQIERPLIEVLACMERRGILIDCDKLEQHNEALKIQLQILEDSIFELAQQTFNINSPKQLQAILYDKLNLPIIKKTPKGQPATGEEVLSELAHEHELPKQLLAYRSLSKLIFTYTDKLPKKINRKTKRLHTSYHQTITATGRLSSADPNLQNIPIRTQAGRQIRQAFVAKSDYYLVAADYSQIELRIMAHLSHDPRLLQAFFNDEDVHQATASELFGVALDQVNQSQRRSAKAINFGLIYGMSAFGLAKQLNISRESAQHYMEQYFDRYPSIRTYMHETKELAKDQGFVETIHGRRLYLKDIHSRHAKLRHAAERTAINAPLQGSAADIIKMAMINADHWLKESNYEAYMLMQVHDELVFEVKKSDLEPVCKAIKSLMSDVVTLAVPLTVDMGYGENWDEAH